MPVVVEGLRAEELADLRIGVPVDHQSTQDCAFHLQVLRLLVAVGINTRHLDHLHF